MAMVKNPGIGRGKGGGRPKRGESVKVGGIDLSPKAAELLQAHLESTKLPLWKVFDDLVKIGLGGEAPPEPTPALPPLACEIAQEVRAFLGAHLDNPQRAARTLRRSWTQALSMAEHELKAPQGE